MDDINIVDSDTVKNVFEELENDENKLEEKVINEPEEINQEIK